MTSLVKTTGYFVMITAAALACASRAAAVTQATLLGPDLKPEKININALSSNRLSYFDKDKTLQNRPLDQILQLRFETATRPQPDNEANAGEERTCYVELADGQRMIARWQGSADEGQAVRVLHASLGAAQVPLDDLKIVRFDTSVDFGAASTDDRLIFANGDTLDGFLISVGDKEIEFQPAGGPADADPIKLPLQRIKGLRLGNDAAAAPAGHHLLHLADGSRVYGRELAINGGGLSLRIALPGQKGAKRNLDIKQAARIEFVTPGRRLVNLVDLPRRVIADGQVFGRTVRPRASGVNLHLHAPVHLEITLPKGAVRVAALAELDINRKVASLGSPEWANFDLVVRDPTETIKTYHFDYDHQRADVNVQVRSDKLIIQLDPAGNGPIMDRLRLVNAIVLVKE